MHYGPYVAATQPCLLLMSCVVLHKWILYGDCAFRRDELSCCPVTEGCRLTVEAVARAVSRLCWSGIVLGHVLKREDGHVVRVNSVTLRSLWRWLFVFAWTAGNGYAQRSERWFVRWVVRCSAGVLPAGDQILVVCNSLFSNISRCGTVFHPCGQM